MSANQKHISKKLPRAGRASDIRLIQKYRIQRIGIGGFIDNIIGTVLLYNCITVGKGLDFFINRLDHIFSVGIDISPKVCGRMFCCSQTTGKRLKSGKLRGNDQDTLRVDESPKPVLADRGITALERKGVFVFFFKGGLSVAVHKICGIIFLWWMYSKNHINN